MTKLLLQQLKKGQSGTILSTQHENPEVGRRLLEMGLMEGSHVQVIHEAPFGGDPIVIRVRGALIALRRKDTSQIEVEV